MAAIPPDEMERRISAGSLYSTYAAPIDRESAHEILSARLAAARAAMVGATGAPGTPGMTPTQERRAIEARARELERVRRDAERQAKAADRERERQDAADRREAERAAKQQADMIEEIGGGLIRGVFGTLFGRPARRRR
jgi:predicted amino acid dehydrogenase